jgi:hypothetical protein
MSTKSRSAKMRAEDARQRATTAARAAARAARPELWSIQMEAYGGPAQPTPTIGRRLNGSYRPPTPPQMHYGLRQGIVLVCL